MTPFQESVYGVVAKIREGEYMTYKQVAEKIGNPHAFRAVGAALRRNYDKRIPCHRVIRSDGHVGGYNRGGCKTKRSILIKEGALK